MDLCKAHVLLLIAKSFYKRGECDSLNQVLVDSCVECVRDNSHIAVGVKVRLSADARNEGATTEDF